MICDNISFAVFLLWIQQGSFEILAILIALVFREVLILLVHFLYIKKLLLTLYKFFEIFYNIDRMKNIFKKGRDWYV